MRSHALARFLRHLPDGEVKLAIKTRDGVVYGKLEGYDQTGNTLVLKGEN
jgi:small nuclear ribonucleoprotein (snRNP)-like protein